MAFKLSLGLGPDLENLNSASGDEFPSYRNSNFETNRFPRIPELPSFASNTISNRNDQNKIPSKNRSGANDCSSSLQEAFGRINSLVNDLNQSRSNSNHQKQEIINLRSTNNKLINDNIKLKSKLADSSESLILAQKITMLEEKLRIFAAENGKLFNDNKSLNELLNKSRQEEKAFIEEKKQNINKYNELVQLNKSITEELTKTKLKLKELKADNVHLMRIADDIQKLKKNFQAATKENDDLQIKLADIASASIPVDEKLQKIISDNSKLFQRVKNLREENSKLQNQILSTSPWDLNSSDRLKSIASDISAIQDLNKKINAVISDPKIVPLSPVLEDLIKTQTEKINKAAFEIENRPIINISTDHKFIEEKHIVRDGIIHPHEKTQRPLSPLESNRIAQTVFNNIQSANITPPALDSLHHNIPLPVDKSLQNILLGASNGKNDLE